MVLIECGGVCQRLELPFIIKLLFELHNLPLTFRVFFHNCTTLMHSVSLIISEIGTCIVIAIWII